VSEQHDDTEKTISLTELLKDREELVAQARAISGALNYINQKIAILNKEDVKEPQE